MTIILVAVIATGLGVMALGRTASTVAGQTALYFVGLILAFAAYFTLGIMDGGAR